jgi:threonine/homoserine/homoserine lactone efflux protein
LCLNLCPFIRNSDIAPGGRDVLNFKTHAPTLLRNERKPGPINHFSYQNYRFTRDWLSLVATPVRAESFKGVRLTLSDSAVEKGKSFVATVGLASNQPVILYNPDTASRFTLMPFDRQVEFLLRLTRFPVSILLGEGHTEAGIGVRLKATLPASLQEKVSIVPAALPLDAYAALIDRSDVFISGDTGPLHIAAAVTLGSVSSDIIYGGIALFGLAPLLQLPGVMAGFNALGAVLLCGLAYWTIRQSRQPHELRLEEATLNDQRWAFVTGFSLAASNPPMILSWLYGATLARHLGLAIPFSSGQKLLFIAGGALGLAGYQLLLALILKRMQHFIPAKVLRRIYFWLGIVLFLLSFFFIYNAQRLFFSKPQGGG